GQHGHRRRRGRGHGVEEGGTSLRVGVAFDRGHGATVAGTWPSAAGRAKLVPMMTSGLPAPAPSERRRRRSDDPLVALHYQLAHARQEGQLEAIVVADDAGVVVAGAGAWATCEELAAYAPILAQGQWTEPGLDDTSRMAELRGQVDVQAVDVDGQ